MNKVRLALLCFLALAASHLHAGVVTIGFDAPTLNELLPAMMQQEVTVPIAGGRTLQVFLEDLKVLGFVPAAAAGGANQLLTSVRLRVPSFGLDVPLEPRVSLEVVEEAGQSLLQLRFDEVALPLPLAGSIDVGSFLEPLRYPTDSAFNLQGGQGDVGVKSRLLRVEMGAKVVRFDFDVDVADAPSTD
jgi:hypothetical protein